ncbi:peroxiredoxin Q/BCP [Bathymodiolus platifrons methanotrophic gill symbiont]|uniref:peroxiredoxin n=1 Tax=Bathymodiolus platifrons methanotrophic gill symbiont TaxID=113268 RepID=UPI000B419E77|nr:peroxiredoxin [Bathymodiolus platifrons methanotrophic gill symbiont]MCK5869637.1 peroxiredoxin [Methyloprofundus sp.]TXK97276.1 peroxiredoxin [Methylococcaceae bacterium CS4]TXK97735.1 peroxiredoxin [Methylococcaceae bacterium HT1]TXK97927.1 peroxiredoxin [Methylococcaceae bacterium CS5]TXL08645.1 peroxiredoxin [Methylococcaceae bacterium CS1]TXL08713.1 peroxiredoxin [Methylococcaceae bacterium CS3]TXL12287.1 peroxiredoxin [Methylococcaceae bacterium CS2]TXL15795.1 peroxiredoxin [Methyl
MSTVSIGKPVSNFEAPSTGDKSIQLSDYQGKYVLLYFYPKDNTPGCITEGQNFRDNIAQFEQHNTVILGVSRDSVRVHEGFKTKQNFPFDLLSDKEEVLCNLFDVIKMKNMYGKKVLGIERSTFLIDPDGVLIHEWRKVKVKVHLDEVLQKLSELESES